MGRHTNNISELYAIGLALHIIQQHPSSNGWIKSLQQNGNKRKIIIRILSDSQYSIGVLSKNWKAKKNQELIGWIKKELSDICNNGYLVLFHWVGGHSGIKYNEMADSLANKGVDGTLQGKKCNVLKPPNLFNGIHRNKNNDLERKRKLHRKHDIVIIDDDDEEEEDEGKDNDNDDESDSDEDQLVMENLRGNKNRNKNNNPLKRPNKKRKYNSFEDMDNVNETDRGWDEENNEDINYSPITKRTPFKKRKVNVGEDSEDDIQILNDSDFKMGKEKVNEKVNEKEIDCLSQRSRGSSTPPQSPTIL